MNFMKVALFIIGLVLIRYVGGIPEDSNNFFIVQFIFFAPYLVEYYQYLRTANKLLWTFIFIGFVMGFIILIVNILGIMGIIQINNTLDLMFNNDYHMGIDYKLSITFYLNMGSFIYLYIFFSKLAFENRLNESLEKENEKEEVVSGVNVG